MVPYYLSKIKNFDGLKFVNTNEGLNIDTKGMKNEQLRQKIIEKLKLAGKDTRIVYYPSDKLSDTQLDVSKKIQKTMAKKK